MKLYLDLCVYNRPFDYQGYERVALETSIFTYILEKIETGVYILVASDVLAYENNKNPDRFKSARIATYFELAKELIEINNFDCERIKILKEFGFSDIDALHISLAERSQADYFITVEVGERGDVDRGARQREVFGDAPAGAVVSRSAAIRSSRSRRPAGAS